MKKPASDLRKGDVVEINGVPEVVSWVRTEVTFLVGDFGKIIKSYGQNETVEVKGGNENG